VAVVGVLRGLLSILLRFGRGTGGDGSGAGLEWVSGLEGMLGLAAVSSLRGVNLLDVAMGVGVWGLSGVGGLSAWLAAGGVVFEVPGVDWRVLMSWVLSLTSIWAKTLRPSTISPSRLCQLPQNESGTLWVMILSPVSISFLRKSSHCLDFAARMSAITCCFRPFHWYPISWKWNFLSISFPTCRASPADAACFTRAPNATSP